MPSEFDLLIDRRVNCLSIMTTTRADDFLHLVEASYDNRGGLEGQRDPLKTSSAIRIRKRMLDDLVRGAVLPPVVVGIVIDEENFEKVNKLEDLTSFKAIIDSVSKDNISIIDGMQRTTALIEVRKSHADSIHELSLRVEYWVSTNTNSLIYRMLVLNTGQVPWNLRRQIEVVFKSLIQEVEQQIPAMEIILLDDAKQRRNPGQFHADHVVELFMVFGARKEKVDTQERLADEFTRLDFIEATSYPEFTKMFCESLELLVKMDCEFNRAKPGESNVRFANGRDLFGSKPASIGFIAAIALKIYGRPGATGVGIDEQKERLSHLRENFDVFHQRLQQMSPDEVQEFLDYSTLNEMVSDRKTGKVGDFEREFFLKAFQTLIEEDFRIERMTPSWRAF